MLNFVFFSGNNAKLYILGNFSKSDCASLYVLMHTCFDILLIVSNISDEVEKFFFSLYDDIV